MIAKLAGLEGAGELAGGHEEKYEENGEESDLPRRRGRR